MDVAENFNLIMEVEDADINLRTAPEIKVEVDWALPELAEQAHDRLRFDDLKLERAEDYVLGAIKSDDYGENYSHDQRSDEQLDRSEVDPGREYTTNILSKDETNDEQLEGIDSEILNKPGCSYNEMNKKRIRETDTAPSKCRASRRGQKHMSFEKVEKLSTQKEEQQSPSDHRPFKCVECVKSFKQKGVLAAHMRTHKTDRPYECSACGKSFHYYFCLKRHSLLHHEKGYTCVLCNRLFRHKLTWERHRKIHVDGQYCQTCNKCFRKPRDLEYHYKTHSIEENDQTKPTWKCEKCGNCFGDLGVLQHHIRQNHSEKPNICSVCGKRFARDSHLTIHFRSHTRENRFHCSICVKHFSSRQHLSTHMLKHTGEKPYKCEICEKTFTQKVHLKRHAINTHEESEGNKCSICEKMFTQPSYLRLHILTHTGEKPHTCSACDKRFSRSGTLLRHVREVHTGIKRHKASKHAS